MIARRILLFIVVLALAAMAAAQQPAIKKVPIKATPAYSGQEMYDSYCAVCHGKDGRGAGPAASALKTAPTDLTTLSAKNGGKFPELHVYSTIRGEADLPAHGSKDMPVWGPLFRSLSPGQNAEVQLRITNLTKYIEGLQAK